MLHATFLLNGEQLLGHLSLLDAKGGQLVLDLGRNLTCFFDLAFGAFVRGSQFAFDLLEDRFEVFQFHEVSPVLERDFS